MIYILFLLAIIAASFKFMPPKGVKSITTKQLKEQLHNLDLVLVDVRDEKLFNQRRIEGFINMPLGSDYTTLPKEKEIVLICHSGITSAKVAKQLSKLGYAHITNVRGGMMRY